MLKLFLVTLFTLSNATKKTKAELLQDHTATLKPRLLVPDIDSIEYLEHHTVALGDFVFYETERQIGYGFVTTLLDDSVTVKDNENGHDVTVKTHHEIKTIKNTNDNLMKFIDAAHDLSNNGATIKVLDAEATFDEARQSFQANGHRKITEANIMQSGDLELIELFRQAMD